MNGRLIPVALTHRTLRENSDSTHFCHSEPLAQKLIRTGKISTFRINFSPEANLLISMIACIIGVIS
jgi:hypothetical protein